MSSFARRGPVANLEEERDELQSELDQLRQDVQERLPASLVRKDAYQAGFAAGKAQVEQDVEPVLRVAERAVLRFERNDRGGLWERNDLGGLWTILRLLEGELIAFRQQHPKEGNDG